MVSLGDDNRQQAGNRFGSEPPTVSTAPSVNGDMDELMCDRVALISHVNNAARPYICTTWMIVLHITVLVMLAAAVFVVPMYFNDRCKPTDVYCIDSISIIMYAVAFFWLFTAVASGYYKIQHSASRAQGYLEFYRRTRTIRQIPLLLVSATNSFLLILVALLHSYCDDERVTSCGQISGWKIKSINYVQLVVVIETLVLLFTLLTYLVRTCKFNRHHVRPDIQQEEIMSSYILSNTQSIDVGLRTDRSVDQILEKQADMIGYLKQHTAYLSEQLLKLQEQLSAKHLHKDE